MQEKIYNIYQSHGNKTLIEFQICGITYPDKNYKILRNQSPVGCIEFVEKGSGVIQADHMQHRVNEGDTYFLQPRQNQYYYADAEDPWTKYFINVSGPLLKKLIEAYNLKGHICFKNLNTKKELCEIIALCEESGEDHTVEIVAILTRIFHKMYEALSKTDSFNSIGERMCAFLEMKAVGTFRMEELCAHVSLSKSQTIRLFKAAYGITPYAYFMSKKTELAKNMLLNAALSIKQIAYELNYADEYYFSNAFKKQVGLSPREFRKAQIMGE